MNILENLTPKAKEAILREGFKIIHKRGVQYTKVPLSEYEDIAQDAGKIIILQALKESIDHSVVYVGLLVTEYADKDGIVRTKEGRELIQQAQDDHNKLCDFVLERMVDYLTTEELLQILGE